jgi:hypothetical protein
LTAAVLLICIVDLFAQDVKPPESKTLWAFFQTLLVKAVLQTANLSNKLGMHEHSLTILYCCLFILTLCAYLTKQIPLRYAVFSPEKMKQLDVYGYMIAQTKHKYQQMTTSLNQLALQKQDKTELSG